MNRVGIEFDGRPNGAVGAARQTREALRGVRQEAGATRRPIQELDRDLGKLTRGAIAGSGVFRGLGRSIAFASAGFLGGYGLTAALRGASSELTDSIKIGARVQQVIRATGGVAGVTAREVDKLADAEQRKTGIDDEIVKSGAAVLLTFRSVRDVAGEGNDVFTQAIRLSHDLADVMGTDLESAVLQVGKALQDPILGITALRRAGVSFDAQQRKQIKTLVEHGRLLDAQKIILKELRQEVGGTAEAVGKVAPWDRLRESIRNLSAEAIRPLLPEIDGIVGRVQKWADELANNKQKQAELKADVEGFVDTVGDLAAGVQGVVGALGGWKRMLELLLALKVASTLTKWTAAVAAFTGAEAAGTGVAGAAGATGLLNTRLKLLRVLTSKPFQFVIAYEIIKTITGSNADLSDDAGGPGDLLPVYKNGKWVDPTTGTPVPDQAYWNRYFRKTHGAGEKPKAGQTAGDVAGSAKQRSVVGTAVEIGVGASSGIYVYGGTGGKVVGSVTSGAPDSFVPGYDCSGYVQAVYQKNGISIPRTSQGQFADPKAIKVGLDQLEPGDAVFFNNGSKNVQPDHVGIVVSGHGRSAVMIDYFHSGQKAEKISVVDKGLPFMGGRRWIKSGGGRSSGDAGADPPKSGATSTATASSNPVPSRIRALISAADVAVASAALTPGKADDRRAITQQRAALNEEIAWLQGKLRTNLGTEKRITLEQLLTGALGDLKGLSGGSARGGAGISTVTSLRASVNQTLRHLPADLNDTEQRAVAKLEELRDKLKVGMSPKDLAQTRAAIKRWGDTLRTEIAKQGALAKAAAEEAARVWGRTWNNDVAKILRDFRENVVDTQLQAFDDATDSHLKQLRDTLKTQLDAFDAETKRGLANLAAPAETPEERALAEFQAQRKANDELERKQAILDEIADVERQLAGAAPGAAGTLIDIATGTRTGLGGDTVSNVKELQDRLTQLRRDYHELELDDQEAALEQAARASRDAANTAADAAQERYQAERDAARDAIEQKEADTETAYQRERAQQRQHLEDMLADQATHLEQDLEDWNLWLSKKAKSWEEFVRWMHANGLNSDIINPFNPGAAGPSLGGDFSDDIRVRLGPGKALAFATGGRVPGMYVGRNDTVLARLTEGEEVIDRSLSRDLRAFLDRGAAGPTVAVFKINDRELAHAVATPMSSEQQREIGYRIQRG